MVFIEFNAFMLLCVLFCYRYIDLFEPSKVPDVRDIGQGQSELFLLLLVSPSNPPPNNLIVTLLDTVYTSFR